MDIFSTCLHFYISNDAFASMKFHNRKRIIANYKRSYKNNTTVKIYGCEEDILIINSLYSENIISESTFRVFNNNVRYESTVLYELRRFYHINEKFLVESNSISKFVLLEHALKGVESDIETLLKIEWRLK